MRPATLALLAPLIGGCQPATPDLRTPDVVILSVDTLRADHVGAYSPSGGKRTPNIDALAADGILFEQAYSPISVTGPAFCSLHTGRRPGRHGVVLNLFRGGSPLADDITTLAEHLQNLGYRTGAFVSGFTLRPQLGLMRGFDTYDCPKTPQRHGEKTAQAAAQWLQAQEGPVFLWFHTFDPHGPLKRWKQIQPSPDWERNPEQLANYARYQRIAGISALEFYTHRYEEAVHHADLQVGMILAALRDTQRMDDAWIVFNADHGESFDERGLWFDHGTTAFEEQLHIPLIIRLPQSARAGEVRSGLVSLQDVAPTLLQWMGSPGLAGADGLDSILTGPGHAVLTGESSHCKEEQGAECAPTGHAGKMFVARDSTRTLVRRRLGTGVVYELYDRVSDPGELQPLTGTPPPHDLRTLVDAMAEHRQAMGLVDPGASTEGLSDQERADAAAELEAMRALGYADGEDD